MTPLIDLNDYADQEYMRSVRSEIQSNIFFSTFSVCLMLMFVNVCTVMYKFIEYLLLFI